jgi:hypothetical protein
VKIKILAVLLFLLSAAVSQASDLKALLLYKIRFEAHSSSPTDVVVEAGGGAGVYDAFSGSYLTFNRNGKGVGSVKKRFLKGGNCLVKSGKHFFFCNNTDARLDVLSEDLEKLNAFKLPFDMKGRYDPTDALISGGFVFSVDNDNHRIIKADLASGKADLFTGGYGQSKLSFRYPYSLAVDSKGILYVSEVMNTRVQKITKELKFYEFIGNWGIKSGEFYRPTGIAVYQGRTLLVADGYTGIIQHLDMNGKFIGVIADDTGRKLELGSITHIRVNEHILAVVDAFGKSVYVFELKGQ